MTRRFCRSTLIVLPLLLMAFAPTAAQAESAQGGYAGDGVCAECHQDEVTGLATTHHGKGGFSDLSSRSCEACHGPGRGHSEDPGDEALLPSFLSLSADEQSSTCQSCHKGEQQFFWDDGPHAKRGLSCVSCHSVHNPLSETKQLKTHTAEEQCFECHKDVRAETWKRSHHPIREGQIGCADCHNPHGSATEKMLVQASVNDQCYTCHAEKRGPFLWEHAPVRESCLNCHTPHGSNHFKLQKTSTPFLCQQCHANTRHPGTLYDATTNASGTRPSNREFNRGCTNCHSAVHGSNHPSSPYLAR